MRYLSCSAVAAVACLWAAGVSAQNFQVERIADGLARPVFVTTSPGDDERLFVVEQHTGDVRILRKSTRSVDPDPFLSISGISTDSEQGLLGLAFHPDYATNGFVYVYFTDPDTQVVRFEVSADPDEVDASTETPILSIAQPQDNHNAGWIGFGPDGYLYVASGDGGGGNDDDTGHTPGIGNGQDITNNLLGKILRIDVDGDDFPLDPARNYAIPSDNPFVGGAGDDEIWVYGLRNPWRVSFDRGTGDLYIADVGQNRCEEIDVQPASSVGGENYGWRLREGVIETPNVGGSAPGATEPIFDYPHPSSSGSEPCSGPPSAFEGISVTGGYVYRGPIAELQGRYFFADFGTGRLWSLRYDGSDPSTFDGTNYTDLTDHGSDPDFTPDVGSIAWVSSFGEDESGNLYVVDLFDGEVFLIPEPTTMPMLLSGGLLVVLLGAKGGRRRA